MPLGSEVQPTGGDDTSTLQAAIDALEAEESDSVALELNGEYTISSPGLACGTAQVAGTPRIFSTYGAKISVTGDPFSGYALAMKGTSESPVTRLENISFDCGYKCRGVLLSGQTYGSIARNVLVYHPRGVGMDVIDCWGSSLENCYVDFVYTGTPFRFYRFNGGTATQLRARGIVVTRTGSDYSSAINYAMANGGLAAADTYYGDTLYHFPAADDTLAVKYDGTAWAPGVAARCGMYISASTGAAFRTVLFEGCYYVDYPILKIASDAVQMHNLYFESNLTLDKLVDIAGSWNTVSDVYSHPDYTGTVYGETGDVSANLITNVHQY